MTSAAKTFLVSFMEGHRTATKQRQTVRALNGLSIQALKDIGINRSQIHSVVAGLFENPKRG